MLRFEQVHIVLGQFFVVFLILRYSSPYFTHRSCFRLILAYTFLIFVQPIKEKHICKPQNLS